MKHISKLPASIAKFERDLKVFRVRTEVDFPEVLKLPILIQMIPPSWKKEFETQFRTPGADRTYEALVSQLLAIRNEERYMAGRRGPDDMDTDNLEKQVPGEYEKITQRMYEGAEPKRQYSDEEWAEWQAHLEQELQQKREEISWLGKAGGKGGNGRPSKGGGGKGGWTSGRGGRSVGKGAGSRICLWCHKPGHFRKYCAEFEKYKKDNDADRANKR